MMNQSNECEPMEWEDIFTAEDHARMDKEWAVLDRIQRKGAIKHALQQWCKQSFDYHLNPIEKAFYTIKAIICILLKRKENLWAQDCVDAVAMWDYVGGYRDSWNQLNVGHGIFKDWHYDIFDNSSY